MIKVGLYAPYSRQEATHLALTLAELAEENGCTVDWLSTQAHEQGLCTTWDARVQHPTKRTFKDWTRAHRCGHVVWFDVQPDKVELSRKQGCCNTLVLLWHRLNTLDVIHLGLYDHIVCPSATVYKTVKKLLPPHIRLSYVPWSPGLPSPVTHFDCNPLRVFLPLDGATAQKAGPLILHNAELLLASRNDIELTIGHCRNWNQPTMHALSQLTKARPQRVRVHKRTNWRAWREEQERQHWTFLPSLSCNTAYMALDSLRFGIPVLTFDVAPLSDCVRHGVNGHLMPCNVVNTNLSAPTAVFNPRSLLQTMEQVLTAEERKRLVDPTLSELYQRHEQFRIFWVRHWDQ